MFQAKDRQLPKSGRDLFCRERAVQQRSSVLMTTSSRDCKTYSSTKTNKLRTVMSLTTKRNSKGFVPLQMVFYCICTLNMYQFMILKIEIPCPPNACRTGSLSRSIFYVLCQYVYTCFRLGSMFQGSSTQASCRLSCRNFKCCCSLLLVLPLCWATMSEVEFAEMNIAITLIQMLFFCSLMLLSCRNMHIPLKTLVDGR